MTRKELTLYYNDRKKLRETGELLSYLRAYAETSEKGFAHEISVLEESIPSQIAALRRKEADALATLAIIDDDFCREALKMHYCQGMYWKEIASVFGETAPIIRARCQKALNQSTIPFYPDLTKTTSAVRGETYMTRKELALYYKDRRRLREIEETLVGLREYAAASGEDCAQDIAVLEETARARAAVLRDREADVLATLDAVEDVCRRTELRMHYYRGMSWEEIASILGTTLPAMNNRRTRALNQLGSRAGNGGS